MNCFHILFRFPDELIATGKTFKASSIIDAIKTFFAEYPEAHYIASYAVEEQSGQIKR